MRSRRLRVWLLCACVVVTLVGLRGVAQPDQGWAFRVERLYTGVLRPIPVSIDAPSLSRRRAVLSAEIELIDPGVDRVIARAPIDLRAPTIDLARIFPVIWTARFPRVLYAQLLIDNEPSGAPLVIEPLLSPPSPRVDALTARVMDAYREADTDELNRLLALPEDERERQRARVAPETEGLRAVLTGVRVYAKEQIVLETSRGPIRVRLRPDAAPRSAHRFLTLAQGGFYDDVAFHRVVRSDERGRRVLIQSGDPTGTGAGTPGEFFAYEPSAMRHGYAVLSMARDPREPNTNGGQFFIVLSDEVGPEFDGRYTAFAEIVAGADALEAILRTPLARADPDDPDSPRERPLEPVVIERVRLLPAPPIDRSSEAEPRITPRDETPVIR